MNLHMELGEQLTHAKSRRTGIMVSHRIITLGVPQEGQHLELLAVGGVTLEP